MGTDRDDSPSLPAQPPSPEVQAPTPAERLHELSRMLRRRWLLIAFMVVLVTGAALASSLRAPDEYDATAKLLLRENEPIEALLGRTPGAAPADPEREANTKVALIKLDAVADRVARKLSLRLPAEELLDKVSTEVEATSDIVAITVRDRDPDQAARLATAFAQEYVAFRRGSARSSIDEAAELARSRLRSLTPEEQASEEGRQLEGRLRELEIAASLQTGGVEVVRLAAIPRSPATTPPLLIGLLGLFLGLVVAVFVALILEFADRRLKDEEEAQAVFELPLLATIPRPSRGLGAVILDGDRDLEEAYGTLAANVVFSVRSRELGALMITSARAADGKTSVTLGLARALKTLGKRVIVVEADLHDPRFVQSFDLEQRGGLSSLLAEVGTLENELVALDAYSGNRATKDGSHHGASVSILPAGPVPPNPSAMLARPVMGSILHECRQLADVVLIDTAPVGLVHEPLTLVNHVDGVLLVSRLQWTKQDAARRTMRLLRQVNAPVMGLVVTGGERQQGYYGDLNTRHYGRPQPKPKPTLRLKRKPKPKTTTPA